MKPTITVLYLLATQALSPAAHYTDDNELVSFIRMGNGWIRRHHMKKLFPENE